MPELDGIFRHGPPLWSRVFMSRQQRLAANLIFEVSLQSSVLLA